VFTIGESEIQVLTVYASREMFGESGREDNDSDVAVFPNSLECLTKFLPEPEAMRIITCLDFAAMLQDGIRLMEGIN